MLFTKDVKVVKQQYNINDPQNMLKTEGVSTRSVHGWMDGLMEPIASVPSDYQLQKSIFIHLNTPTIQSFQYFDFSFPSQFEINLRLNKHHGSNTPGSI